MAFTHHTRTCRRCSCRRQSCQRRKAEQRRRVEYFFPHAQFFLIRDAERRSKYFARKEPPFEMDEEDYGRGLNEVAIDREDLRVMRDSVDQMQQQLSRGLQDLKDLRAMVKEAVRQREGCKMIIRRADMEHQQQE